MKDNPNLIRECYYQDTGEPPERDRRAFMDWCEGHVKVWKASRRGYGLNP